MTDPHPSPIHSNTLARALYARDAWRNKAEMLRREAMRAGFWNEGMGQYWPESGITQGPNTTGRIIHDHSE